MLGLHSCGAELAPFVGEVDHSHRTKAAKFIKYFVQWRYNIPIVLSNSPLKLLCLQANLSLLFFILWIYPVCRTQVAINGEVIGDFTSYPGSTFNALGIRGVGVNAFSLKHVDVDDAGGISLMEVGYLQIHELHVGNASFFVFSVDGRFYQYLEVIMEVSYCCMEMSVESI